jgi:hypothetical protein
MSATSLRRVSGDCVVQSMRPSVEPDAAEMARKYGADTGVLEWRERLLCFPVR